MPISCPSKMFLQTIEHNNTKYISNKAINDATNHVLDYFLINGDMQSLSKQCQMSL